MTPGWFALGAACPKDETPLDVITTGSSNGFESTTMLGCPTCLTRYGVNVRLFPVSGEKYKPAVDGTG